MTEMVPYRRRPVCPSRRVPADLKARPYRRVDVYWTRGRKVANRASPGGGDPADPEAVLADVGQLGRRPITPVDLHEPGVAVLADRADLPVALTQIGAGDLVGIQPDALLLAQQVVRGLDRK